MGKKRTATIVGLIGSILATVSVALTWVYCSHAPASGIDILSGSAIRAITTPLTTGGLGLEAPILVVLIGGILALVGAISMLATEVRAIALLLPIGGILALAGGIWGHVWAIEIADFVGQLAEFLGESISANPGDGIYMAIVGAILALIGTLGLKGGLKRRTNQT